MKIENDPVSGKVSLDFSLEDVYILIYSVWKKLFPKKTLFLNYSPDWLAEFYFNETKNLLKSSDLMVSAPYIILHDYRKNPIVDWGNFEVNGDFEFPNKLARVKTELLKKFSRKNLLYKGDNVCPRVCEIIANDTSLLIRIQKAYYYDQVATNLSVDYKLNDDIKESIGAETVRKWDIAQSKTSDGYLPTLKKSKLANTIGVAVGIIAINKFGQKTLLIRKRTSSVAVYNNMLHLPFSFALNFDTHNNRKTYIGKIFDLIIGDLRHEQADELGLEPSDIDLLNLKPLVFCRDLCRGGKPQFILEITAKIPYEDLISKISERLNTKHEFAGNIIGLTMLDARKSLGKFSPELLAYIAATS